MNYNFRITDAIYLQCTFNSISDSNVTLGKAGFIDLQVNRFPLSSGFGINRNTLEEMFIISFGRCSSKPGPIFSSSNHHVVKAGGREPTVSQTISDISPARRGY